MSRSIKLNSAITPAKAKEIISQLDALEKSSEEEEIILLINSPGGDLTASFELFKRVKNARAPILGVVEKEADSMAVFILQACRRRVANKEAVFILHSIRLTISDNIIGWVDDRGELTDTAIDELRNIGRKCFDHQVRMEQIFAARCCLSLNQVWDLLRQDEKKIDAKTALELGLIDSILP
jgi:ATP-dependent protease ClpP protease subunit